MANGKQIAVNRKAFFDYEVLERLEVGLVLTGTEIKSIRAGRVDLRGSYARPQNGELWLHGMHISPYDHTAMGNHEPKRSRKLLIHRDQLSDMTGKVSQRGLALVPLRLYVKKHWAKAELGLVRGKKKYDKRRAIIDRDRDREARRAIRHAE